MSHTRKVGTIKMLVGWKNVSNAILVFFSFAIRSTPVYYQIAELLELLEFYKDVQDFEAFTFLVFRSSFRMTCLKWTNKFASYTGLLWLLAVLRVKR